MKTKGPPMVLSQKMEVRRQAERRINSKRSLKSFAEPIRFFKNSWQTQPQLLPWAPHHQLSTLHRSKPQLQLVLHLMDIRFLRQRKEIRCQTTQQHKKPNQQSAMVFQSRLRLQIILEFPINHLISRSNKKEPPHDLGAKMEVKNVEEQLRKKKPNVSPERFSLLKISTICSLAFILEVTLLWKYLENPNTFEIHLLENGERYREVLGNFENVYLIKVKDEDLGMEAPEDLSFDTILVYIPRGTELGINYSNSTADDPLDTTVIEEYLEQFKIPVKLRNFIINSITLEFSKLPLGGEFTEPSFARENSMVHELEDALKKETKKTEEELKKVQEELENTQKKTTFLHLSCSICFCCEPYCFSRFSVVNSVCKNE